MYYVNCIRVQAYQLIMVPIVHYRVRLTTVNSVDSFKEKLYAIKQVSRTTRHCNKNIKIIYDHPSKTVFSQLIIYITTLSTNFSTDEIHERCYRLRAITYGSHMEHTAPGECMAVDIYLAHYTAARPTQLVTSTMT